MKRLIPKQLIVHRLFGLHDYEVNLHHEANISLWMGPNGSGKTILLQFMYELLSSDLNFSTSASIPFELFRIHFTTGESISLSKSNKKQTIAQIIYESPNRSIADNIDLLNPLEGSLGWLIRLKRFFFPSMRYLETSLWHHPAHASLAEDYPSLVRDSYQEMLSYFGKTSMSMDLSLLNQGFSIDNASAAIEFADNLKLYKDLILQMQSVLLVDPSLCLPDINAEYFEFKAILLRHYVEKIKIFVNFAQKLSFFRSLIESNFVEKIMVLNPQVGFTIVHKNGTGLPLKALSAGEKQFLVLFLELLFCTQDHSIALIDEPELSLNSEWKNQLITDLSHASQLTNCKYIIATQEDSWKEAFPCVFLGKN